MPPHSHLSHVQGAQRQHLYFCIHPTKVLHKNLKIMTNVGCIHILEIVLLPSPPELIFVTHATHGLSVIFLLSLKRKSAKSTVIPAMVQRLFFDIIIPARS